MRAGLLLSAALVLVAGAGPALAQNQTVTRGDQAPKPTTTSAPPRTGSTPPSRTMPSTLPVDPGGMSGMPGSGSPATGPDYGPMGPGGTRTTRPRRSTAPPTDPGAGGEIPYVDPPAAPGYESATDAPMKTAGGKPVPGAQHAPTPATPAAPAAPTAAAPAAPRPLPAVPTRGENNVSIVEAPGAPPPGNSNALWIALAGLIAMLGAAGLGLRHILTAPHLTFRVTVDHGVQSQPKFKGAAS